MSRSRIEILNFAGTYLPPIFPRSLSGLRHDNRRPYELRACNFAIAPHAAADGSATVTQGLTTVQASVFGPREARQRAGVAHDRASVVVEVGNVPWAQGGGQGRGRSRGDK
jgi:exosome complex component RRP41